MIRKKTEGEDSESNQFHQVAKLSPEPGEDQAPTVVQAPWWTGRERDDSSSSEEEKSNREPTRFFNAVASPEDVGNANSHGHVRGVAATLTVDGKSSRHTVLNLSQKHLLITSTGQTWQAGTVCSVSLKKGNRSAAFQALVLSAFPGPPATFGLHISSLTRAQLTDLVLFIEEDARPRTLSRATLRSAALVVLGCAAVVLGSMLALRPKPRAITTVRPSRIDIPEVVQSAPGDIAGQKRVTVRSELRAPRVFAPVVKSGARVVAGEIVVRAEDPQLLQTVVSLRQRLGAAEFALRRILMADAEADADERTKAEAAVFMARAELRAREADVVALRVAAPMSGIVYNVRASGDAVAPGGALLDISDDSTLHTKVAFTEADAPRISKGMQADVWVTGVEKPFHGLIHDVDVAVREENGTRVVMVDVALKNDARIRLGSSAKVVVPVALRKDVLALQASAIDRTAARPRVFLAVDGHAVERSVELGAVQAAQVEVKAGLDGEARVIADPSGLKPGERIADVSGATR